MTGEAGRARVLLPRGVVLRATLLGVMVASVLVALQVPGIGWTVPYSDGWNYLAAGERLNAGRPLYELHPGDRPVLIVPPYWTTPLLAPPPIAVAWRPLAALGDPSMLLWGAAAAGVVGVSSAALIAGGGLLAVALLSLPLALVATSANFSAFLIGLLIVVWRFRDRPWVCGLAVAVAGVVKVTPFVLVAWLLLTGRRRAALATAAWSVGIVLVSLPTAGWDAWSKWISVAPDAAPSPLAIATWTGLPTLVAAGLVTVPVVLSRRSEHLGFTLAVVALSLSTPALYFTAIAQLVVAPLPWLHARRPPPGSPGLAA